ncbi:hypothetical protein VPNG_06371 [Cytospora leucostoma]|uniref:SnoaL-like domain-containing protein n=1 Tax=Cytospora leucostoma TaxID=1230097 RepID=A0A423WYV9_9PEZI|nr:hypothetical protein VPNG_06371 [Cytospora leucostoma]
MASSAASWALPATLSPPLTGREAVQDALYRCVLAFDTGDVNLLTSALTTDAKFKLNDFVMDGLEAIISNSFDRISKLDTTHFITNTRVNLNDDGKTASMTASALSQHYRPGTGHSETGDAPRLLAGALYRLDLVKDEDSGLWKIKVWDMKSIWQEGSSAVLFP